MNKDRKSTTYGCKNRRPKSGLLTFAIMVFSNYALLNPLVVFGDAASVLKTSRRTK